MRRGFVTIMALLAGQALAVAAATAAPPPEDSDDFRELAPYHDWFVTRQNSLGGRCCDEGDGRPVEAIVEGDHWRAHITPNHWPLEVDHWVTVPANRVLREANPTGVSILWLNPYTHRPQCFLPAAGT